MGGGLYEPCACVCGHAIQIDIKNKDTLDRDMEKKKKTYKELRVLGPGVGVKGFEDGVLVC